MAMQEMDKAFDFKTAQQRWYGRWEASRLFEAQPDSGKAPWSIVIPPPNITGNLHMGHALVFTLHDILTRFKRAQGFDALWVPGVDHAGIATQVVVERQLKETEGKTRHEVGREAFLQRLWAWKDQNQGDIENQLRRLGASVDWTRKRFTMDPDLNRAVRKVFAAAYKQGKIYKGPRMIQWDPASQTALSDLEVKYVERNGKLWHIRYPLADGSGHVVVATTRPETMLGDTGVAVHPEDARYAHLVGRMVKLPLTDREIPVVQDTLVDPAFGTGCVKLTPAHDPNDHAAGKRLGLPSITVIGFDAKMTKEAGEGYAGLDRFECRKKVVHDLEELGLMEKIEPYTHQVSVSDRSGAVLEPLVSEQWFMKVDDAARKALEAVRGGRIRFTPERWATVWEHWLVNIQDWCISRQLWWGHRIPAWTCDACGHINVEEDAPAACAQCGGTALTQDPDTLDTWFSSALWPFSVFGWPDETADLKRYYPTSVLITGYDILFFWVARMVMAGLTWMDEVPFRDVYFNALVRDEHGAKMSKSKGNVIDPLETMDEFGTDALRYSLAAMAAPGTDISLSRSRLEASRNFCNKLWNAARFVQMSLTPDITLDVEPELGEAEFWMIRRLREALGSATKAIEEYRFHEAAEILYHLVWDDFCATYIELAKVTLQSGSREQKAAILHFLDILLRALHPLVPFVTEEIHAAVLEGRLPKGEPELLAARAWPLDDPLLKREGGDPDLVPRFQEVLSAFHRLKAENGVDPAKRVPAFCTLEVLAPFAEGLKSIARLESVAFGPDAGHGATRAVAVVTGGTVALELAGLKDPAAEKAKLEKEKEKLERDLAAALARLADESFTTKAPEAAVAKMRAGAEEKQARLAKINELLAL
ncbi:valine--tRNA ligase [Mesoterricola sediminis]|uniref:Valine--tRNA ligase n=1 Tax=Mesoterricola sediminis TaxID=2927980 RepID=A0AA48KC09_9BACT|nr:valine--tRNA ligase [Mesoterricola sediminis]BDU75620.1 valine--tRNA ligase [Mesoterricola sediminis]